MRLFFFIISIAYIAAVFLFAGSPVVSDLAPFNPYSLLHIPLYGILATLLMFSFVPIKSNVLNDPNKPMTESPNNSITQSLDHSKLSLSFFLPGIIALLVAIVDEVQQSFIPTRNASVTDVFLDVIGIALALFIILKFFRKQKAFTIFN